MCLLCVCAKRTLRTGRAEFIRLTTYSYKKAAVLVCQPINLSQMRVHEQQQKKSFNNVKRLYMKPDVRTIAFFSSFIWIAFAHDQNGRTNWVSSHSLCRMNKNAVFLRVQLYIDDRHGFGDNVIGVETVVSLWTWQYSRQIDGMLCQCGGSHCRKELL